MLKQLATTAILGAMLVASPAIAKDSVKIGIVNVRDIMQRMPEAENVAQSLEKEFKVRRDELIAAQNGFKEKIEKFERDQDVLSDTEKQKFEKDILTERRDIQQMDMELRQDAQRRQQEETQKLLTKIDGVLDDIAKAKGYDMVLHRDAAPYFTKDVDITEQVFEALSKKS